MLDGKQRGIGEDCHFCHVQLLAHEGEKGLACILLKIKSVIHVFALVKNLIHSEYTAREKICFRFFLSIYNIHYYLKQNLGLIFN